MIVQIIGLLDETSLLSPLPSFPQQRESCGTPPLRDPCLRGHDFIFAHLRAAIVRGTNLVIRICAPVSGKADSGFSITDREI